MKSIISTALATLFISTLNAAPVNSHPGYPAEWWAPIPESERQSWEILPQDAGADEVIVSKRTELGVFSNLTAAPFEFEGTHYASVEGLWQMMKYPETS